MFAVRRLIKGPAMVYMDFPSSAFFALKGRILSLGQSLALSVHLGLTLSLVQARAPVVGQEPT